MVTVMFKVANMNINHSMVLHAVHTHMSTAMVNNLKAKDLFNHCTQQLFISFILQGKLQTVNYVSDAFGFRVVATNLPEQQKPVEIPDSDEIAAAKKVHFKAHKDAIDLLNKAKTE